MEKLAIFDIDGTLNVTEVMTVPCYEIVMTELGLPVPVLQTIFKTFGANIETIYGLVGIEGDEKYKKAFLEKFEAEELRQMRTVAKCYDGVLESIRRLNKEGVTIGLCSMCSEAYMSTFSERFQLNDIVKCRGFESEFHDKRFVLEAMLKEYEPEYAVMVGDRKYDRDAAAYNKIPFVGCLYGYGREEVMQADVEAEKGEDIYDAVMKAFSIKK